MTRGGEGDRIGANGELSMGKRLIEGILSALDGEEVSSSLGVVESRRKEFARRIARGRTFEDALRGLNVEKRIARAWMLEEGWREEVRREMVKKDEVVDEVTSLIPAALKVKRDILSGDEADLKLKNDVASEIIKWRGLDKLYEDKIEEFSFSQRFVDGILTQSDSEIKGKKIKRVDFNQ